MVSRVDFLRGTRGAKATGGDDDTALGTWLGLEEVSTSMKGKEVRSTELGLTKEEGGEASLESMEARSGILIGVTKESVLAKEKGATSTSKGTKGFATLVETKTKGKECSWKTTFLETKTLWVYKSSAL